MATSFSTIKNRPPNSTKKIQVIEKVIENPVNNVITHYGPYPYGVTNDRQDTVFIDTPMYMLINLIDLLGVYETLQFDTLRLYITNLRTNTNPSVTLAQVYRSTWPQFPPWSSMATSAVFSSGE